MYHLISKLTAKLEHRTIFHWKTISKRMHFCWNGEKEKKNWERKRERDCGLAMQYQNIIYFDTRKSNQTQLFGWFVCSFVYLFGSFGLLDFFSFWKEEEKKNQNEKLWKLNSLGINNQSYQQWNRKNMHTVIAQLNVFLLFLLLFFSRSIFSFWKWFYLLF